MNSLFKELGISQVEQNLSPEMLKSLKINILALPNDELAKSIVIKLKQEIEA